MSALFVGICAAGLLLTAFQAPPRARAGSNEASLPGTVYPSQGNVHINPGDSHPAYNSNPPTSGWHYPSFPKRGIYSVPLPDEWVVHFLEHGGVAIHVNQALLSEDQQSLLRSIVNSELSKLQETTLPGGGILEGGDPTMGRVILLPNPNISAAIAVAAWQHLVTFDSVSGNETEIAADISALECQYDPEGVCGTPRGHLTYLPPIGAPGETMVVGPPLPNPLPQPEPLPTGPVALAP